MYMVSRRPAPIETVGSPDFGSPGTGGSGSTRYVITDGDRMMEVLYVEDMNYELGDSSYAQGNHSNDMLMAYLPKEKILINADLYSPPAPAPQSPGVQPPTAPTVAMLTLYQNIRKYKLDVAQHVPIHGRLGTNEEFVKLLGAKASKVD